MAILLQNE